MDPFDDILPVAPAARTRLGAKFVPKAKPKQLPQKEIQPLEHTTSSNDGILGNECQNAVASNTSSTNQRGGDSLHEAGAYYNDGAYNDGAYNDGAYNEGAYNEGEFFDSDYVRDPYDDQANERIRSTFPLYNDYSFFVKTPGGKWSKQETELLYEALREMGTDFTMIQVIFFPKKTRHQVKLKYKKEELKYPSRIKDAVNNHAKDHPHSKLFIEHLQLASTKAEEDPGRDASEMDVDITAGTKEEVPEVATTKEDPDVKAQEDPSPEQSDDSEDDFDIWSQYKSEL